MFNIFLLENIPLILLGIIWISVAIVMDFRKREVANWWNFSLIVLALVYRAFISVFYWDYNFFLVGVVGLIFGVVIGNLFYYMRLFAGGDAKLMYGVGVIIPLSLQWQVNVNLFIWFLALFLILGGVYGLMYSIVLAFWKRKKFAKEYIKQFKKFDTLIGITIGISLIIIFSGLVINFYVLSLLGILLLISPFLLVYAKAIEEACLVNMVDVKELTIGDWLAEDIVFHLKGKKKVIKGDWQGLSENELIEIQNKIPGKKVLVKYGAPFTPSFLLAYIGILIISLLGLNMLFVF